MPGPSRRTYGPGLRPRTPGYQATRYDDTGRILPALIREAEAAGGDDEEACSVRAPVYDTTAALLHRVGETSLAWTAADRALTAAEQSGRPELTAVQAYRLTYVLVLRPGASLTHEELRAHVKSLIAVYKARRSLEIADKLPLSGTGKVLKRDLRRKHWGDQERQIH